jgi:phosphoribosylaminoimidazole-succinocarboxamide synthase
LAESQQLDEPLFTPSTKAELGQHDLNIRFDEMEAMIGKSLAHTIRDASLKIYKRAASYAQERGIIIADTKLEFGLDANQQPILIDEVLTPDSSRFWPMQGYAPGGPQPSFDKQFVRDYLTSIKWNKTPPAPRLPREVIEQTTTRYRQAYNALTT